MHTTNPCATDPCGKTAASTLGAVERFASMGVGALLAAAALRPRLMLDAGLLGGAGYLMYRGATGRCPLRERVARRWARSAAGADEFTALVEHAHREPSSTPRTVDDPAIDEAAAESFPASDPPASTGSTAAPTQGSTPSQASELN